MPRPFQNKIPDYDMLEHYLILYLVVENTFQYSLNIYHLFQIFCKRDASQTQTAEDDLITLKDDKERLKELYEAKEDDDTTESSAETIQLYIKKKH